MQYARACSALGFIHNTLVKDTLTFFEVHTSLISVFLSLSLLRAIMIRLFTRWAKPTVSLWPIATQILTAIACCTALRTDWNCDPSSTTTSIEWIPRNYSNGNVLDTKVFLPSRSPKWNPVCHSLSDLLVLHGLVNERMVSILSENISLLENNDDNKNIDVYFYFSSSIPNKTDREITSIRVLYKRSVHRKISPFLHTDCACRWWSAAQLHRKPINELIRNKIYRGMSYRCVQF